MTSPEIVLITLSRGRLPSLRRTVNSALANAGVPINVQVFFDDDLPSYNAFEPPPGVSKHILTPRHYYVRGINKAFRHLVDLGVDIFAVCNNDTEFIQPNWAAQAKADLFDTFEEGFGVAELSNAGGKLHTFVSRVPFYQREFGGQLFDPAYLQYYADRERMKQLEANNFRFHYIPGFAFNHEVRDAVNAEGRSFFQSDKETFYSRHPEELERDRARAAGED